jgi:hypothetical protein
MGKYESQEAAINQYLEQVKANLGGASNEEKKLVLADLREHISEAVSARTRGSETTVRDVYAVLSEMDPPERYGQAAGQATGHPGAGKKLTALSLICSFMQILGLILTIVGVPVIPTIGGFAAFVNFFLIWSRPGVERWLVHLTAVAAIAGGGIIVLDVTRMM